MTAFPSVDTHRDTHGDLAPLDLLGRRFRHTRRNKVYEVIGFCWIGDTDEWGVLHSTSGDPVYVRSQRNFRGNLDDGKPRYEEET